MDAGNKEASDGTGAGSSLVMPPTHELEELILLAWCNFIREWG